MNTKIKYYLLGAIIVHLGLSIAIYFLYNPQTTDQLNNYAAKAIWGEANELQDLDDYTITLGDFSNQNDPMSYDFGGKRELSFIYEPLVNFDDYFNIKPRLAVSWGMLSKNRWQFNLRQNVFFHDGSEFDASDVLASFSRAQNRKNSSLTELLSLVEKIEKINDYTIVITTHESEPTFLAQLTNLFIVPEEVAEREVLEKNVGTGPFREISRNLKTIKLIKYEQYWDDFTSFPWSIILQKTANKYQRIGEIFDGKTNLVADFPPVFAQQIESRTEALIKQTRGVKSVFVLFNLKSDFLAKRSNRQALNLAINRRELNEELGNANRLINQFTGSGVFGYNPDIDDPQSSLILAQDQLELGNQRIFNLALAKENQVLGEFIQRQLEPLGIRLRLKMVNSAELIELVQKGEEDMYLMGWDYSGGSVDVFYRDLVQSSGKYNGLNYGNEELDLKIKKALNELNEEKRLLALQEIMQIITSEDPLGIPLFAIDNIYALYPSPYSASIRPDGIIHFR